MRRFSSLRRRSILSPQRVCSLRSEKYQARGLCKKHYERLRRYGRVNLIHNPPMTTIRGVLEHVGWSVTAQGCWEWAGNKHKEGYGELYAEGRHMLTHRAAYSVWVGPIEKGLLVRHKCDNRLCINPDHLETGTHADNARDMRERGRNNHTRKLTSADVVDIRWLHCLGARQVDIARAFNVSKTAIRKIVTYRMRVEN